MLHLRLPLLLRDLVRRERRLVVSARHVVVLACVLLSPPVHCADVQHVCLRTTNTCALKVRHVGRRPPCNCASVSELEGSITPRPMREAHRGLKTRMPYPLRHILKQP